MNEQVWLTDSHGNRASVEYFGTCEKAQAALDSLKNCDNCTNCSDCSDCSGCSGCSRCSDCSGCSRCSDCSDCSGCSRCSGCSGCSGCSHIAWLDNKTGLTAEPGEATATLGAPMVPRIENIHQKVYAAVSQPNAFDMGNWHKCGTTHCRGGWVVTLAGEAGKALEDFHNPELAAMLIYYESGYHINPACFYDSNAEALADMKRLAEEEAAAAAVSA